MAKVAIFYHFLSFQGPSSEKQKKIFLTEATPPKPSTKTKTVLWNLWGKFLHTHTSYFFKKSKKTTDFLICSDVISRHFYFYQNYTIAVKYNHLEIYGENLITFGWDLRSWWKKRLLCDRFFYTWLSIIGVTRRLCQLVISNFSFIVSCHIK